MILLIEWMDANIVGGWRSEQECKPTLATNLSVGFLVDETDEAVCIAMSKCNTEGNMPYGELLTIPKCAIIKQTKGEFTTIIKEAKL